MNIEFKEPFFRFIFPASLLWALFLIFGDFEISNKYLPEIIIYFIATALIINSLGSILMILLIKHRITQIDKPETEVDYWRKIAEEKSNGKSDLVERKVDRRWDYFTSNLNNLIAIIIFAIWRIITSLDFSLPFIWVVIPLLILFSTLTYRGFRFTKEYPRIFK